VKYPFVAHSDIIKMNIDEEHNHSYEHSAMANQEFTAAQIATALQRPKRSVLEALKQIVPSGMKIVHGNPPRGGFVGSQSG
jgi:hypothetical protein